MTARERIDALLDSGSFVEIGAFISARDSETAADGVVTITIADVEPITLDYTIIDKVEYKNPTAVAATEYDYVDFADNMAGIEEGVVVAVKFFFIRKIGIPVFDCQLHFFVHGQIKINIRVLSGYEQSNARFIRKFNTVRLSIAFQNRHIVTHRKLTIRLDFPLIGCFIHRASVVLVQFNDRWAIIPFPHRH